MKNDIEQVRCISLHNKGAFVARIRIKGTHTNGKTYTYEQSGYHDICAGGERSVDLANTNGVVQPGDLVHLYVVVKLGKDKEAKESFVYNPKSCQIANYTIKGTTLKNTLKYDGIPVRDDTVESPTFEPTRYFKLVNKGLFVARMQIVHSDANGKTGIYEPSGYHDICYGAERTIDLASTGIKDGETVTLRAYVVMGKNVEATESYTFKKSSGGMASYQISGTTLKPKIKKI